jgi:hypothetical protein
MLLHENTLISLDLLEKEFVCNLDKCKGACCVEGESGAPLDVEEIGLISEDIESIKPYMEPRSRDLLEKDGFHEYDKDGDLVTRCMNGRACIFAITENGIYKCAIEKAFNDGKTSFRKPLSCHLYPVRISKVGEFLALNYSKWEVCDPACKLGRSLKVPVYKFLKESLERGFGAEWYQGLVEIAAEYTKQQG